MRRYHRYRARELAVGLNKRLDEADEDEEATEEPEEDEPPPAEFRRFFFFPFPRLTSSRGVAAFKVLTEFAPEDPVRGGVGSRNGGAAYGDSENRLPTDSPTEAEELSDPAPEI